MYSTIIVDDDFDQQESLLRMMKRSFPDYSVAAVCSSVNEGIKKIHALNPQLIFLDVELPPKTGFDLLNEMDRINFEVIFTTSFSQYAIQAFKVSAVDYLLKPFEESDLRGALDKFEKKNKLQASLNHIELLLQNINGNTLENTKVALPTYSGYVCVHVNEIVRCESEDVYTTFYFSNRTKIVISRTIKQCEDLLADYNFLRIHNSHLVNMRFVQEFIRNKLGTVKMTDGSIVELARNRKAEFLRALNKL